LADVAFLSLYVTFSLACKKTWTSFSRETLYDINIFLKYLYGILLKGSFI
jgi:hypothetical protein